MLLNEIASASSPYNPPKWTKATLVSCILSMKEYDDTSFRAYIGLDSNGAAELSTAIMSFKYDGIDHGGRKHEGGYSFKVIIDHSKLAKEERSSYEKGSLEHLVIVTPVCEDDGVKMHANIFDGRNY